MARANLLTWLKRVLALKGNIRILLVQSIIGAVGYGIFFPIWQPFVLSLGASMSILGGIRAILTLLGSSSSLLWGKLSDRAGRKPLIILAYALRATALTFCLFAKAWHLLIPYAIFMGLSASFQQYNPAMASLIAESVRKEERGTAYSVLMASSTIVSAVIAPIGGILAMMYGFNLIFLGCIAVDLFNILLTRLFIEETLEEKIRTTFQQGRKRLSKLREMFRPERHLKGFYLATTIDAFAWGIGSYILYGMLVKTYNFAEYQLGLLSTISSLVWGISQIPIGKLIDRYGRKPFLLISELIGTFTLLGWLLSRSFLAFAILQIPFGIMIAAWVPAIAALLADSVPMEKRAEAMGRLQAFRGLLAFPAPYIGGLLFDELGFSAPILANLIGSLAAFCFIFFLVKEKS